MRICGSLGLRRGLLIVSATLLWFAGSAQAQTLLSRRSQTYWLSGATTLGSTTSAPTTVA